MSKITINAILAVLRLALALIAKVIRLLYSVADLVDDGCINASVSRPDWMLTLMSVISSLETIGLHASNIEDEVYKSSIPSTNVKD